MVNSSDGRGAKLKSSVERSESGARGEISPAEERKRASRSEGCEGAELTLVLMRAVTSVRRRSGVAKMSWVHSTVVQEEHEEGHRNRK